MKIKLNLTLIVISLAQFSLQFSGIVFSQQQIQIFINCDKGVAQFS